MVLVSVVLVPSQLRLNHSSRMEAVLLEDPYRGKYAGILFDLELFIFTYSSIVSPKNCRRECSLDTECPRGKCCFDGCAMRYLHLSVYYNHLHSSCITSEFAPNVHTQHRPAEIVRHNKSMNFIQLLVTVLSPFVPLVKCPFSGVLTSSTSSCPPSTISLTTLSSSSCISHCSSHSDCSGLRLCCEKGCEKKCVYPAATTRQFHSLISLQ